jgi:cytoskeletal protein RodZ
MKKEEKDMQTNDSLSGIKKELRAIKNMVWIVLIMISFLGTLYIVLNNIRNTRPLTTTSYYYKVVETTNGIRDTVLENSTVETTTSVLEDIK